MLDKIFKFLLGDDIFISYSRADGATYAAGLANELAKPPLNFSCKLDQWGTQAGAEMPESLKKSLRRSAVLVLIGTEGAAKSRNVALEIEQFKKTGRMIIPVIFDGILLKNNLIYRDGVKRRADLDAVPALAETEASWAGEIEGLPVSWEKTGKLKTGNPSPEIVSRIEKTFTFSRKDERLRKTSLATAIFLLLLLIGSSIASIVAFTETKNAAAATNLAAEKEQIANQKTKDAETATNKAEFEANRAAKNEEIANQKTEEARIKTREADEATRRAEEEKSKAEKASKLADEKTNLAAAAQKEARAQTEIAESKRKEADAQAEKSRQFAYANNIQRAAGLYKPKQLSIFNKVLNRTDENLRGFEWNYLEHLQKGVLPLDVKSDYVVELKGFSPDGKYLITAGPESSLATWDMQTGEKTKELVYENSERDGVSDSAFSPDPDGRWFAICGGSEIIVWDRSTSPWTQIQISGDTSESKDDAASSPNQDSPENYIRISFIKDKNDSNKYNLVTVSRKEDEYFLRRWDISTKKEIGTAKKISTGNELTIEKFLSKGQLLITYKNTDSSVQVSLLDAELKETKLDKISSEDNVVFSDSGERVAYITSIKNSDTFPANNHLGRIFIRDISKPKESGQTLKGSENTYYYEKPVAIFSPDGKFFAVATEDSKIKVWNIEKNEIVRTIPTTGQENRYIVFSPDGSRLVFAGYGDFSETALTIWDINSTADVFTFNGEKPLDISSDGSRAVTTNDKSKTLTLWSAVERSPIKTKAFSANFSAFAVFSRDGKHLLTASHSIKIIDENKKEDYETSAPVAARSRKDIIIDEVEIWDAATGDKIELDSNADCKPASYPVFSADGKKLAEICKDDVIRIWSAETGKELHKINTDQELISIRKKPFSGYKIEFVQNDSKIAIYNLPDENNEDEGILELWDINNGAKEQVQVCSGKSERIIEFSPDGKWWITIDEETNYRLRNKTITQCDSKKADYPTDLNYKSEPYIFGFAFSDDSRYVAVYESNPEQNHTMSEGFYVAALNENKPKNITAVPEQEQYETYGGGIRFSRSGNWLVIGNFYWNLKTNQNNFIVTDCTDTATFSMDESRLITACIDGTIKLWSLTSGQEVLSLEKAHNSPVKKMVLTKDNKYLLTADDEVMKLWKTDSKVNNGNLK